VSRPSRFRRTPRIHDISTDTDNPPALVAASQQRCRWQNPVTYEGERIARLQHQAYPDIRPIISTLAPEQAWVYARDIVVQSGWKILREDVTGGTIEAVAVTPLMRFRDDVVIRVQAQDGGSRVDIRSASRLGISDLGTNARRIRTFIGHFTQEL
jgi:uncharacterized protein (DUF1499 family)